MQESKQNDILLARLDERLNASDEKNEIRFSNFEKSVTMMFDEMVLRHKEILSLIEKKADSHLLDEVEKMVLALTKALEDYQEKNDDRMKTYDKLIWKGTGALMVGGFLGGFVMTILMNRLQSFL